VQILSNALPGLRDLRGPIIADYMWLVFVWLLTARTSTPVLTTGIGGTLYAAQDT
jgi:hypothetical protein